MLLLLCCFAEWRERGSCITACLHLNPSMALSTALANSFRLREAAVVVASGGDAGVEWRPASTSTRAAEGR